MTGNGTGGESMWGGYFEDEFSPKARFDRPYTLAMANAGGLHLIQAMICILLIRKFRSDNKR